jgi:hypothetical protein
MIGKVADDIENKDDHKKNPKQVRNPRGSQLPREMMLKQAFIDVLTR